MTTATANLIAREPLPDHEQKKLALGYLHDAWIEATHDGIDGDCLAQTALFLALAELTTTYGEEAAARYESELRNSFRLEGAESPRFDLIALGMGPDGHCASLFPHTAAIHEMSRLAIANHVPQQKESWRITLTWPVINHAGSVFFLIAGADKAAVLNEVLTGPRDPERLPSQLIWPASGILTLILDKAAAALLPATNGEGCGFLERER